MHQWVQGQTSGIFGGHIAKLECYKSVHKLVHGKSNHQNDDAVNNCGQIQTKHSAPIS